MRRYREFSGADLLIHDAEYTDEEYRKTEAWGHSRYRDALHLALDARVRKFVCTTRNRERSDDALDAIVDECRRIEKRSGDGMLRLTRGRNRPVKSSCGGAFCSG
ncbi:MAG: hypothetical protein U0411_06005 [Thermodesulfovibrionales bacterium]